jgi:hypothetical protein
MIVFIKTNDNYLLPFLIHPLPLELAIAADGTSDHVLSRAMQLEPRDRSLYSSPKIKLFQSKDKKKKTE